MKILIADDSKTNLALLTASLEQLGNNVIAASSGEEAIILFQRDRPDLIILDVVMEGMDGFQTAKKIRELTIDEWIPIIFLSSQEDDHSIEKGINAGGDDYLIKPVSDIKLAAKIKAMQRISDMRQQLCETAEKLNLLSSTDALTGLYNRFQFSRYLKEKIAHAKRHQKLLILMYMDLDHFKIVNDSLGHQVGDLLLKEVAHRLKLHLREEDFIARLGGDEFAIILSEIEKYEHIEEVATKIINAISPSYNLANHEVRIGASIGIAYYPTMAATQEDLIKNADIAMYHAKKAGRNNYQFFTEELNQKHEKRVQIENALKYAIQRQQLFLTYQPIFELRTKKIISIEALVSWNHPKMGIIPPSIFIPIAEEENLINEIGEWVLYTSAKQCAIWSSKGHSIYLSINISGQELIQKEFPDVISNILKNTGLNPSNIHLELSEKSVMNNVLFSENTIQKLDEVGVKILIDNFGTGFSSLLYLTRLPISALKIDKLFIDDFMNKNHAVIIKSTIALGKNLGINVIANGIETEAQFQFLIDHHCPSGQGFYLSRPLPSEKIEKMLEINLFEENHAYK